MFAFLQAEQIDDDIVTIQLLQQTQMALECRSGGFVAPRHLHFVRTDLDRQLKLNYNFKIIKYVREKGNNRHRRRHHLCHTVIL